MKRPLLWASVGVLIGVSFAAKPTVLFIALVVPLLRFLLKRRRLLAATMLLGIFLGAFTQLCYQTYERKVRSYSDSCCYFEGTVSRHTSNGYYVRLSAIGTEQETWRLFHIYQFTAYVQSDEAPEEGTKVILEGVPESFTHAENPGQFDSLDYYKGIGTLYRLQPLQCITVRKPSVLSKHLSAIRNSLSCKLQMLYQTDTYGLTASIFLGDRSSLLEEERLLYERFGVAHILAISGLHISILSELLSAFLLLVFPRRASDLITALLLLVYGALCGFSISCMRAILCFLINAYGRQYHRSFDSLSANSLLLICILTISPYRICNLSFQLSFASGYLLGLCRNSHLKEHKLIELFRTSLYMQSGLLPIVLQSFYSFSILGILFNVLVLSGIELLFILLILSVILAYLSILSGFLFAGPVHYMIKLTEGLMRSLSALHPFEVCLGHQELFRISIYYLIFAAILYFEKRGKWKYHAKLYLLLMLLWIVLLPNRRSQAVFATLSVGQGDCNVILCGGNAIVIDCGSSNKKDVGEKILKPFLNYYGYQRIDYLFLSHTDHDHTNGLSQEGSLLNETKLICTDEYYHIPESYLNSGTKLRYTKGGEQFSIGMLAIKVISTKRAEMFFDKEDDANSHSQILLVTYQGTSFLYTGDSDAETLGRISLPKVYYLKVPHHGSRSSLNEQFYDTIKPNVSVISVGRNSYGHPHQEVMDTLNRYTERIFLTKEAGAVITVFHGKAIDTYSYLNR